MDQSSKRACQNAIGFDSFQKSGTSSPWRSFLLCRRGRWTLDCGLKQNVLLLFEAQKRNFRNRPETHARVCALVRGFFAASSEVFLFARLDLGAMDRAPHSNGLNLESSQRNTTRASTARGATSCKNNMAFCRMGLTQNSFVLQDSRSSASIGTVCLLIY